MENKEEKPIKIDIKDELAKERTHEAHDRTMMAWVRTALTLIGFGVGIFEFVSHSDGTSLFRSSKTVGVLLIVLGVVSMILAIKENKDSHKRLMQPDYKYTHKTSLGIKIGYVLVVIGLIALVNIVLKIVGQGV